MYLEEKRTLLCLCTAPAVVCDGSTEPLQPQSCPLGGMRLAGLAERQPALAELRPLDNFPMETPPYRAAASVVGVPTVLELLHLRSPGALMVPVTLQVGRTSMCCSTIVKKLKSF